MANGTNTVLDGAAIEAVAKLAQQAATVQQFSITTDGGTARQFADRVLVELNVDPKRPDALQFTTLQGLVDYLFNEPEAKGALVHVVSPVRVEAISPLFGNDKHLRRRYAVAEFSPVRLNGFFNLNTYDGLEVLNVALQTAFAPGVGDVESLRKLIASVRGTKEVTQADDGISQQVTAKRGVSGAVVDNVAVRNIWELAPWRTFLEVAQPTSPYVLRFLQGTGEAVEAALFETANTGWHITAVQRVGEWLRKALADGWKVLA